MVKFCKNCERVMPREYGTGAVVFVCACGAKENGSDSDARISSEVFGTGETKSMYDYMLRTAPHDRTNQLVHRDCPKCGRDYMVQARIGTGEVVFLRCKCGHAPTQS